MSEEKTFEQKIEAIEQVIQKLDRKDIELSESLELYKAGMAFLTSCNQELDQVQEELEIIRNQSAESIGDDHEPNE